MQDHRRRGECGIVATDIATNNGNYYPKVAARRTEERMAAVDRDRLMATSVQRIGSSGSGGAPSPTPTPLPSPPPPAPCTATPTVSSMRLAAGQTTFPIDVNASSTGCTWSATSNVSWLQIFFHATATGSGSVGVTALHNTSMALRTGTITISGQAVTCNSLASTPRR